MLRAFSVPVAKVKTPAKQTADDDVPDLGSKMCGPRTGRSNNACPFRRDCNVGVGENIQAMFITMRNVSRCDRCLDNTIVFGVTE